MRPAILCLCLLGLAACGGRSVQRIELTPAEAAKRGLAPGFAAATDGSLLCGGRDGPWRFDPATRTIAPLLAASFAGVRDLAITGDGTPLLLRPDGVDVVVEGARVPALVLPGGDAGLLAVAGDEAWIVQQQGAGARLLRWRLRGPQRGGLEALLDSADPIAAICAVRGGCLVASGAAVHKIFTPEPGGQVTMLLLLALDRPVTGLAADGGAGIVYIATGDMTLAWTGKALVPLLPVGGALACAGGTLAVRGADGAIRRQTTAASLVARLAQAMELGG